MDPEEEVPVELIGETEARTALRLEVAEIIEARMRELFEKIGAEITRGGSAHRCPPGLVLTGGGSLLAGAAELGREVLQMPVRVATPAGVGGLTDRPAGALVLHRHRPAPLGVARGHQPASRSTSSRRPPVIPDQDAGVAQGAVPVVAPPPRASVGG